MEVIASTSQTMVRISSLLDRLRTEGGAGRGMA